MSPARAHRDRFAKLGDTVTDSNRIDSQSEGGQTTVPTATEIVSSPALQHRLVHAALDMAAAGDDETAVVIAGTAAAQVNMRLAHDLRRLKEIQSKERKADAKREMLPAYADWIQAVFTATEEAGVAPQDEVLPTIMVWMIDTCAWDDLMPVATHVLKHRVAMPARYLRSAPALIAEEVADVALKEQVARRPFPIDVLTEIDLLTEDEDMHDEIRAKLQKAIGYELARQADDMASDDPARVDAINAALVPLRRAQDLNERAGAKDRIKRLVKMLPPPASGA